MGIDAFVMQYKMAPAEFRHQFLDSADFTVEVLKNICRELGLGVSGSKNALVSRISGYIQGLDTNIDTPRSAWSPNITQERLHKFDGARRIVMRNLVLRERDWATFKLCRSFRKFNGRDPLELLDFEGAEEWYGPITVPSDPDAIWYVRPVHVPHWAIGPDNYQPVKCAIRWLCTARFGKNALSLHWRGFTHANEAGQVESYTTQFRYWEHVPQLLQEVEELAAADTIEVNLHTLVLHKLWDEYRYDTSCDWQDSRIRAESGGVNLSARSGKIKDLGEEQIGGIRHLASVIRRSFELELHEKMGLTLPKAERFDELILGTIIREFGTLSYEFGLRRISGENLFRAHCYFGLRPTIKSQDMFPHVRFFPSWRNVLDQCGFLLDHVGALSEYQLKQLSIFSR